MLEDLTISELEGKLKQKCAQLISEKDIASELQRQVLGQEEVCAMVDQVRSALEALNERQSGQVLQIQRQDEIEDRLSSR